MTRPHVVLIHGASGNASTWDLVLEHWTSWADVTVVELPGRGTSPGEPRDTVADLAAWLADALPSPASTLVGHSLGGAVALQTALDHPDAVGRLVMVSSASLLRVHPAILAAVASSDPARPFRLDDAFGPGATRSVIDGYGDLAATTPPASSLADWRACDAFDVRARLAEVRCPTLVVHGSADGLTRPKHQALLADGLPHADRVELDGIGHMLPWEAPAALAEAVRAWL